MQNRMKPKFHFWVHNTHWPILYLGNYTLLHPVYSVKIKFDISQNTSRH